MAKATTKPEANTQLNWDDLWKAYIALRKTAGALLERGDVTRREAGQVKGAFTRLIKKMLDATETDDPGFLGRIGITTAQAEWNGLKDLDFNRRHGLAA